MDSASDAQTLHTLKLLLNPVSCIVTGAASFLTLTQSVHDGRDVDQLKSAPGLGE
jgi:hypothetical protein